MHCGDDVESLGMKGCTYINAVEPRASGLKYLGYRQSEVLR